MKIYVNLSCIIFNLSPLKSALKNENIVMVLPSSILLLPYCYLLRLVLLSALTKQ